MQLVIDIHKKDYQSILNSGQVPYGVVCAIMNGTPLPKGHGRLKDIDKIISEGTSKGFCDWYDEMKYADTVIEADKEASNG